MKNSRKDIGLLIIRIVFGIAMIAFHGLPKLTGGPELWTKSGSSMQNLGIHFLPTVFGCAAGLVETVASLLLIPGWSPRPPSILLGPTMLVRFTGHPSACPGWSLG